MKGTNKILLVCISLLTLSILSLSVSGDEPDTYTEIGASWEKICIDGKCNFLIYSGVKYAKNSVGEWINATDTLSITRDSDDITFHYDGIEGAFSITFETGVIYNSNYYSFYDVKQSQPDIQFSFPVMNYPSMKKYAVNITNITLDKSKIENIVLTYKSHSGFDISQLRTASGKYIINNIMSLAFDDLKEYNFTVSINVPEKRIYIGNITLDKFNGDSLYLDPTIEFTEGTGILKDIHVHEQYPDSNQDAGDLSCDATECRRSYILWNLSNITSEYKATDAQFCAYFFEAANSNADDVSVYEVYCDECIGETNMTWNNQPCDGGFDNAVCNTTFESGQDLANTYGWYCWNVTEMVDRNINGLLGMAIRSEDEACVTSDGYKMMYDKEDATTAKKPMLNISYELDSDTTPPTISLDAPANDTTEFTHGGVNVTVQYTVNDDTGIGTCYFLNGSTNVSLTDCANTSMKLTVGYYTIKTVVEDTTGNNADDSVSFTIDDTTAPTLTLTNPTNSTHTTALALDFTTYDAYGISSCVYTINGGSEQNLAGCTNLTSGNIVGEQEGFNNLTVRVTDNSGLVSEEAINYTLDTIPPVITFETPTPENETVAVNWAYINVTLNEPASTFVGWCYQEYVNKSTVCGGLDTGVYGNYANWADGDWDTSSNVGGVGTATYYSNYTIPLGAETTSVWEVKDTGGRVNLSLSDCNWSQSILQLKARSYEDGDTNLFTYWDCFNGTIWTNIRTDTSGWDIYEEAVWWNMSLVGTVNLEWNSGANETMTSINTTSFYTNKTSLTYGTNYTYRVWATDANSNEGYADAWVYTGDVTKPELTVQSPTNTTLTSTTVSLDFTTWDAIGLQSWWYQLNGGTNVSSTDFSNTSFTAQEGFNTLIVVANDTFANQNESTIYFTVDSTIPTASIQSPSNTTFEFTEGGKNVSVDFTATDEGGIAECYLINSSGTNLTLTDCTNTTMKVGVGHHTIKIVVVDNNNLNGDASISFTVDDTVSPIISISSPVNGTHSSQQPLNFVATDASYIDKCYYSINGAALAELSSCTNLTAGNIFGEIQGFNNLSVQANDMIGNIGYTDINYTLDSSAPTLVVSSPTNTTHTTAQALTFVVTDALGIDTCFYSINGAAITQLTNCNNLTAGNIAGEQEGFNNLSIQVNDSTAGNLNTEDINYTLDTTVPVVTIVSPTNATFGSAQALNFYATDVTGINKCYYLINGGAKTELTSCTNLTSRNIVGESQGFNNLSIEVSDNAGLVGFMDINYTLDTVTPSISIDSPINLSYSIDYNVTLNYTTNATICWYQLDSGTNVSLSDGTNSCVNSTINLSTDGYHTLVLAGNTSSASIYNSVTVSFFTDTVLPEVKIINTTTEYILPHQVIFYCNVSDYTSINKTLLNVSYPDGTSASWNMSTSDSIGNSTVIGENQSALFDYGLNLTIAGDYDYSCTVIDNLQNESISASRIQTANYTLAVSITPVNYSTVDTAWGYSASLTNNSMTNLTANFTVNVSHISTANFSINASYNFTDYFFNWTNDITVYNHSAGSINFTLSGVNLTWNTENVTGNTTTKTWFEAPIFENSVNYTYKKVSSYYRYMFNPNFNATGTMYAKIAIPGEDQFGKTEKHPQYFVCIGTVTTSTYGCSAWSGAVEVLSTNDGSNEADGKAINLQTYETDVTVTDYSMQVYYGSPFLIEIRTVLGEMVGSGGGDTGGGGGGPSPITSTQLILTTDDTKILAASGVPKDILITVENKENTDVTFIPECVGSVCDWINFVNKEIYVPAKSSRTVRADLTIPTNVTGNYTFVIGAYNSNELEFEASSYDPYALWFTPIFGMPFAAIILLLFGASSFLVALLGNKKIAPALGWGGAFAFSGSVLLYIGFLL